MATFIHANQMVVSLGELVGAILVLNEDQQ
jgi:hypothetical protein